jgi:hypothetical protein
MEILREIVEMDQASNYQLIIPRQSRHTASSFFVLFKFWGPHSVLVSLLFAPHDTRGLAAARRSAARVAANKQASNPFSKKDQL